MSSLNRSARYRGASGFTLIEVLVAVLILGIGILGMAGMQAMSVRESQNTYFRTQADMLAYDIVDRMRANRSEAANSASYDFDGSAPAGVAACGDATSECDSTEMAGFDLNQWFEAISDSSLPGALGTVTQDVGTASVYTVQVFWDENRDGANDQSCDTDPGTDSCFRLVIQL